MRRSHLLLIPFLLIVFLYGPFIWTYWIRWFVGCVLLWR